MRLTGKVAVVTGASMGIGEAIARRFVEEGASVVLSSRDAARVEAARARIGYSERTLAVTCDVRNGEEIDRLIALTLHNFGRCDIWVNNAGHGLMDTVEKLDLDQCRSMFETNLFCAIHGMQVAIAAMRRQGGGTVINISSMAGIVPLPGSAAYSASKAALNAIGKAARLELMGSGVHVMTVCPGYIATDFALNAVKGSDPKRIGAAARRGISPDQVAHAVVEGYLKQKSEVIVPWTYQFIVKLYQLLPQVVENYMARNLRPADQVIAEALAARRER